MMTRRVRWAAALAVVLVAACSPAPPGAGPGPSGATGWATQGGGTTGGGGAAPTTVTSPGALASALSRTGPAVVRVSGTIACEGMLRVASDKSVLGNPGATIAGCGLDITRATNVIVRNLSFRDWDDDAVNVGESQRVWVDHNTFTNGYDGAVDVKRGSDFVTVSWNRVHGHDKSMLLGHSDDNAGQSGAPQSAGAVAPADGRGPDPFIWNIGKVRP